MLLHLLVLTRVPPTPLPGSSCASLSSAPQPLLMPGFPRGSFLSLVLVPEAVRETLQVGLELQHLGREHSYSHCMITRALSILFALPGSMEMQSNHNYQFLSGFFCPSIALSSFVSYPGSTQSSAEGSPVSHSAGLLW